MPLAYSLLLSIASLPSLSEMSSPSEAQSPSYIAYRKVLRLLGRVYHYFLDTYFNIDLSLNDQLISLSAVAHLVLAIYRSDKGGFIPAQLYFDIMTMVKNVYFSVAKAYVANPSGKFWVILLGTDALETLFGTVRTMVGNDTNVDQLQLTSRISTATLCSSLLAMHPEWDRAAPKRLQISNNPLSALSISHLSQAASTRGADHISPRTWKGNVNLAEVSFQASWIRGRRLAEDDLREGGFTIPFDDMIKDRLDILCPFVSQQVVLLRGLFSGEREEDEEEQDIPSAGGPSQLNPQDDSSSPTEENVAQDLEPDLEDLSGSHPALCPPKDQTYSPYVAVDPDNVQHKSTILRFLSNPLAAKGSKDRLRRVRGLSSFETFNTNPPSESGLSGTTSSDAPHLLVQDPALTLLACNHHTFLAVILVSQILHQGRPIPSVQYDHLHEPSIRVRGQVMRLSNISHLIQLPTTSNNAAAQTQTLEDVLYDWEWTGTFETLQGPTSSRDFEGRWVELIRSPVFPPLAPNSRLQQTYRFHSFPLQTAGAILYERLRTAGELSRIPNVLFTSTFPYQIKGELYNLFSIL